MLLVGEVGAAALRFAATLDDLSSVYEASAVCATHFHRGALSHGTDMSIASATEPGLASQCVVYPSGLTTTRSADRPMTPGSSASLGDFRTPAQGHRF